MTKLKYLPLNCLAFAISLLLNRKANKAVKYVRDKAYSYHLSRLFDRVGKNSFWEYPAFVHGPQHMAIGTDLYVFPRLRIEAFEKHLGAKFSPSIVIGNNVSINYDCHIACINRIQIGNHVVIASRVFITDHSHGDTQESSSEVPPDLRTLVSKGPVIIEDNVLIGEGVAILPNVTIGKNSIVGANAVVNSNIPANCVAAGVPARVIKKIASE